MTEMPGQQLTGGCRCGNLRLTLTLTKPAASYTARKCDCSFCTARGSAHVSDPQGRVDFHVRDADQLLLHRFGTGTCDFLICKRCDGYLGAMGDFVDGKKAVVNIRCLDDTDAFPTVAPATFEGETLEIRLARRARNWTPASVTIAS
jgi:hypothetical protein